jgi:DNA-binding NarL/FixJ family response regulator
MTLSRIAQGTLDEDMRVRWLRGPVGRQLVELAGTPEETALGGRPAPTATSLDAHDVGWAGANGSTLDDLDRRLLRLLTEGHTNAEMAAEVGLSEPEIGQRLARLLSAMGASTRAEATSLAFRGFAH